MIINKMTFKDFKGIDNSGSTVGKYHVTMIANVKRVAGWSCKTLADAELSISLYMEETHLTRLKAIIHYCKGQVRKRKKIYFDMEVVKEIEL